MPRAISRAREQNLEHVEKGKWKKFLLCKVRLAPWIAIKSRRGLKIDSAEWQLLADAVQQDLKLEDLDTVAREDIKLSDDKLSKLVEEKSVEWRAVPIAFQPVTDEEEWRADALWALEGWQKGAFGNSDRDYVAVYKSEAKGFGDDPNQLRQLWAKEMGVPVQRIVIRYIGTEE